MSTSLRALLVRQLPGRLRSALNEFRERRFGLDFTLSSGISVRVESRADWIIYNDIFVDKEYDEPILAALGGRDTRRPFTVVDLGANVGYFSLRVVDLARRAADVPESVTVTMVEGSPRLAGELKRRVAETEAPGWDLQVVNGLVGKRVGHGRIHEGLFHPMNSIMQSAHTDTRVAYVDLESVLGPGEPPIDLLKCDIEGAELEFIEHYPKLLPRVRTAVFELHPTLCDKERCIALLKAGGLTQSRVLRRTAEFEVVQFWR